MRSYTAALHEHVGRVVAPFLSDTVDISRFVSLQTTDADKLAPEVAEASNSERVHGILVMAPTVNNYDSITQSINPGKDIDAMSTATPESTARPSPCTPQAVKETLKRYNLWTPDRSFTLVGRGRTVGQHVARDIEAMGAKLDVVTKTEGNFGESVSSSNVVILAAGKRDQFEPSLVHPGLEAVTGVCIGDIHRATYDIDGDLLVTPPHNNPEHMGIGRLTSSIAYGNTLGAAALTGASR